MKTTTKTIICGLAAFALYACSGDNTASSELIGTASTQAGNDKGVQQISLGPSEETAYIETILKGKPISNMIAVDPLQGEIAIGNTVTRLGRNFRDHLLRKRKRYHFARCVSAQQHHHKEVD